MKYLVLFSLATLVVFSSCRKHNKEDDPSSEAAFLSFTIANQISSDIDPVTHTIYVTMPVAATFDALVATFSASPGSTVSVSSVNQVSGVTVNNFTTPVVYTLLAEDGVTTVNWTVTVSSVPQNSADFFAFSVQNQISSDINSVNHTVSVVIPFGSKIDSLVATYITSPGSVVTVNSVSQVNGSTVNDFTNPLTYHVTAQDGITSISWVVTVNYESYIYLDTDFPTGGNTYLMKVDSTGISSYSLGTTGPNKYWNFAGLGMDVVDTFKFNIASQHPAYSHFPGTTYVYSDNNQPFEMFGKISSAQAEFSGLHVNYTGMIFDLPLNDNSIQMKFPAEIGTTFTDHGSVSKDTLTTVPGIPIPVTVTIQVNFDITSTIDANGIITTPLGTFKCIREHKEQVTTIQALVFGNPLPGYGGSTTVRTYNFLNKEKAFPVMSIEVDSIGAILNIKHQK
jgi:hypothetical protein